MGVLLETFEDTAAHIAYWDTNCMNILELDAFIEWTVMPPNTNPK